MFGPSSTFALGVLSPVLSSATSQACFTSYIRWGVCIQYRLNVTRKLRANSYQVTVEDVVAGVVSVLDNLFSNGAYCRGDYIEMV